MRQRSLVRLLCTCISTVRELMNKAVPTSLLVALGYQAHDVHLAAGQPGGLRRATVPSAGLVAKLGKGDCAAIAKVAHAEAVGRIVRRVQQLAGFGFLTEPGRRCGRPALRLSCRPRRAKITGNLCTNSMSLSRSTVPIVITFQIVGDHTLGRRCTAPMP